LTDRKITKTHKENSNIPDGEPTGKSLNLTVPSAALNLLTLHFFVGYPSKNYRQKNISVRKLTDKSDFPVSLSLTVYVCRVPDKIYFSDGFSRFLDGFFGTQE
jgi:hypothetical protein